MGSEPRKLTGIDLPTQLDPADTAKLRIVRSVDDTANFGTTSLTAYTTAADSDQLAERYSEGIIRFYRARTILGRSEGSSACELAWTYLKMLEPHHLPPPARPGFFELAYFMYGQALGEGLDHSRFRTHVLGIADDIDSFLDRLDGNA